MCERCLVPKLRFPEFNDEWNFKILKELTKVVVGYVGSISKYYTNDKGIPVLSTKNITDNRINLNNINYVTSEFHEKNKKSQLSSEDLLIARHGDSGSAFLIPKNLKKAQALNVVIIKNSKKFNSIFIQNYFDTYSIKQYMHSLKAGSVQGVVNTKEIEKIQLNLPSINEQEKISSFLSSVDKKIDLLKQKLNKTQDFKKYLLQNIFSQKLRFDGFNDEWKKCSVKECIIESKLKNQEEEDLPVISSTLNGIYLQSEYFDKEIASDSTKDYKIIKKGLFTYRSMSDTGKFRFNIQNIVPTALVSPAYPVFDVNSSINNTFFEYYLNYSENIKKTIAHL